MKYWLPAIAGMVCLGLGAGLVGVYGFFVEPLSREFDVGVATLNIAPVALLLVPGFVAPFVGRLVDRVSARRLLLTGCTLSMLGLFAASQSPTLLLAGLSFLLFSLGITLYGPVAVNGMLVKYYAGQEARALAIAAIGISLATAVLPPLVGAMLAVMDWRSTLGTLAFCLLLVLWATIRFAIPDTKGTQTADEAKTDRSLYGHGPFWLIGITIALGFNVAMVLAICYPPHFMAEGYSAAEAGWFLSWAGICGLVGKTVMASLGEFFKSRAKLLVAGLLLIQLVGLVILLNADSKAGVFLALALTGSSGGAFLPMHAYINSRYYPADMIGQVTGAQMPLFLPFGLVGPPLAGWVFDNTGSYNLVIIGLLVALAAAASLIMMLPRPRD